MIVTTPTYSRLDPKVKSRWIKSLRSGKFAQTRGKLGFKNNDGGKAYCCLGVLVDTCGIKSKLKAGFIGSHLGLPEDERYSYERVEAKLPLWAREIVGLDDNAQDMLINMNDTDHDTFETIAEWIEENL